MRAIPTSSLSRQVSRNPDTSPQGKGRSLSVCAPRGSFQKSLFFFFKTEALSSVRLTSGSEARAKGRAVTTGCAEVDSMDGAVPAGSLAAGSRAAGRFPSSPRPGHSQPRAAEAKCAGLPVGSMPWVRCRGNNNDSPSLQPPGTGPWGQERTVRRFPVLEGVHRLQAFSLLKSPRYSYPHLTDEETEVPNAH